MEATVPDILGFESLFGPVFSALLPSLALLLGAIAVGVGALVSLRRKLVPAGPRSGFRAGTHRPKMGESGRGDWETMLASYKNLRDEGVLSEEEFRKLRTLVDPRRRTDVPELRARHRLPTDPAGPDAARD